MRLPRPRWWAVTLAVVACFVAFGGALTGPFQFDDTASIANNRTIARLWPPTLPLRPPPRTAVSGRPVVNYTLAINHAINNAFGVAQDSTTYKTKAAVGYRITNILIHLLSAALLFAIIRRTMRRGWIADEWVPLANELATVVTVLWLVHPLQTEAVDYVTQRTELLVSVFYLATLYAAIRSWDAVTARARMMWYGASAVACLLGMGSKEVMASAPLAVMFYDRAFVVESWRGLFVSRRRWFYAALFATIIPLAITILGGARADSVGFGHGISWYQYLYSQGWAIARYTKLAFWPDRLTFDYGENPIHGLGALVGLVVLTIFAVATLLAWRRARWFAFLGTWFFMLLAPSSSFVPIRTEIAAERRFYLALVPVLVLAGVALEAMRRRVAASDEPRRRKLLWTLAGGAGVLFFAFSFWTGHAMAATVGVTATAETLTSVIVRAAVGGAAAAVLWWLVVARDRRPILAGIIVALVLTAASRSLLYADPETLWRDAVAKMPENPRAYDNLAAAIFRKDSSRADEAKGILRQAIAIDSTYVTALNNLAGIELQQGHSAEGRALLERALRINPGYIDATERLGELLVKLGETQQAITYLERVISVNPNEEALGTLAIGYLSAGRRDDAKTALRRMIAINPRRTDALSYLGAMLSEEGRPDEALGYVEAAVQAGGGNAATYALLSFTYAQLGRTEESVRAASIAAAQPGADANTFLQLGRAMMVIRRAEDGQRFFARAIEIDPNNPEALTRLGLAKAATGQAKDAVVLFRRALAIAPGYEPARRALAAMPPTAP